MKLSYSTVTILCVALAALLLALPAASAASAGGPDFYGYTFKDSSAAGGPAYGWVDVVNGCTVADLSWQGTADDVPIGFDFNYYGQNYSLLSISGNGLLGFYGANGWENEPVGNSDLDNFIAPYWDEMYEHPPADVAARSSALAAAAASGKDVATTVTYVTVGTAPNRLFVVTWKDTIDNFGTPSELIYQAILYEGTNDIKFQYKDVSLDGQSDNGASATVGIESGLGMGLQYSYNEPVISAGQAILFTRDASQAATDLYMTECAPASADKGSYYRYSLHYTNLDSGTYSNVTLRTTLPPEVEYWWNTGTGSYDPATRTITWNIGDLPPYPQGVTEYVEVYIPETTPIGTILTSTAAITSDATEANYADNQATVTTLVTWPYVGTNMRVDLGGYDTQNSGNYLYYNLNYENMGETTVSNVTVRDVLPAGVEFVEASGPYTYDPATGTVTWAFGDVSPYPAGGYEYLTVRILDTVAPGTILHNTVVLAADTPEDRYDDNVASVDTLVIPPSGANLHLGKNAPATTIGSSSLTYTLYYYNTGDSTAYDTVLTDTVPADVEFVSASGAYSYDAGTRTVTWNLGEVSNYYTGAGSATVTVKIPDGIAQGTVITNTAAISTSSSETSTADNAASASTRVTTTGLPPDVTVSPIIGGSDGLPVIHWQDLVTFTYHNDTASGVNINIHFVEEAWPDINSPMAQTTPGNWTYSTTFYPRHGHIIVTYTIVDTGETITFDLYIDPAGYIYDKATGKRIGGATVWLQQPNQYGLWEKVPTGQSPAVMQPDVNPQVTGADGQYQWDVLEGIYRVHVEAPGYNPADSIAVIVPPPVTDLNVGLTRIAGQEPPNTTATLTGTMGRNGWYVSEVMVSLCATDVDSDPGPVTTEYSFDKVNWMTYERQLNLTADGIHVLYYRSSDGTGNVEAVKAVDVPIDTTPPVITGTPNGQPNAYGWYNHTVLVKFNATDATSGVEGLTGVAIDINDSKNKTYTCTAMDKAGNVNTTTVSGINVDRTPPVITGAVIYPPSTTGWYNSTVKVKFNATDNLSGIANLTSLAYLTTEGANQSVTGAAIDLAGNVNTTTVTGINIDKTAPVLAISVPANGSSYILGALVTSNWTASDSLSGLNSSLTLAPIDTRSVGTKMFTATATDKAGNRIAGSTTYTVRYGFGSVLWSVYEDYQVVFKRGIPVPVIFQLEDASGKTVSTANANLTYGLAGKETSGKCSVIYEPCTHLYLGLLPTKNLSPGTYQLNLNLDDGTVRTAKVQVKK